eukprot:Gb_05684 [translate_table: standard]
MSFVLSSPPKFITFAPNFSTEIIEHNSQKVQRFWRGLATARAKKLCGQQLTASGTVQLAPGLLKGHSTNCTVPPMQVVGRIDQATAWVVLSKAPFNLRQLRQNVSAKCNP